MTKAPHDDVNDDDTCCELYFWSRGKFTLIHAIWSILYGPWAKVFVLGHLSYESHDAIKHDRIPLAQKYCNLKVIKIRIINSSE